VIDGDLVMPTRKFFAIGLNDYPGQ
jgi:hypothetical protein